MINLVLNKDIRSRTTYEIPVLFGNPQMDQKKLYSYSIFSENTCEEVIFIDKTVAKHVYDINNFLKSTTVYNSENKIVRSHKFEFSEKIEKGYDFIDRSLCGTVGNSARYCYSDDEKHWMLNFNRVDSFLGYKMSVMFKVNDDKDPIEESYLNYRLNFNDPILERLFIHSYDYKNSKLDQTHKFIMEYGWKKALLLD